MFADVLKTRIEAAHRRDLDKIAQALWAAHNAGSIGDADAETIAEMIEVRRREPAKAKTGSRPRSPEHLCRRRRWSSKLPAKIAPLFTPAQEAVVLAIAAEVRRYGRCDLCNAAVAAIAGVGRTTVQAAVRIARAAGIFNVQERRVRWCRNLPNVVRVVCKDFAASLGLRGVGSRPRRATESIYSLPIETRECSPHREDARQRPFGGSRLNPWPGDPAPRHRGLRGSAAPISWHLAQFDCRQC